jgi:hypothetical protein
MSNTDRRSLLMFKRDLRRELWQWSIKCQIPFRVMVQLDGLYLRDQEAMAVVLCLLKTKTFKSNFRQSLATQARKWCTDTENRTHLFPLTPRQLACCKGKGEKHAAKLMPRYLAQVNHQKRYNPLNN